MKIQCVPSHSYVLDAFCNLLKDICLSHIELRCTFQRDRLDLPTNATAVENLLIATSVLLGKFPVYGVTFSDVHYK